MLTRVPTNLLKFNRIANSRLSSNLKTFLKIGDVRAAVREPKNPELVPALYGPGQPPNELLPHIKWLLQKDILKQDVFLLGVPGSMRLELVLRYLEASRREFEYLSITRDTTEADIKQRREIRNGTAVYTDLCAVRAALSGRVLVIDGVERAERNVLPILNNLLENREMQLDDGRFLMKYDKYDQLKEKYDDITLRRMGMERVSEDFHVITLGLPVPRFPGNSLDPPFRSRFQCRNIDEYSFDAFVSEANRMAPSVSRSDLRDLVSLVYAFNIEASNSRPRISVSNLQQALKIWNENPSYSPETVLEMVYPAREVLADSEKGIMDEFKKKFELSLGQASRKISSAKELNEQSQKVVVENSNGKMAEIEISTSRSAHNSISNEKKWIPTNYQENLLADLALAYSKGDFLLIGPKGCGKTVIIEELARRLDLTIDSMVLHQDMNARDLIQRRRMLENGDTAWEDSQLVAAAKQGHVCVLDSVHAVHPSVLLSLSQLLHHRRIDLPDGCRLIGEKEFDEISKRDGFEEKQLNEKGIYRIPSSFRVLLVGESQSKEHKWINEAVLAMAPTFLVPKLPIEEQLNIISKMSEGANAESVNKVVKFVKKIEDSIDTGLRNAASSLSLRRLIHMARRDAMQPGYLRSLVEKAALVRFLPPLTKNTFEQALDDAAIVDNVDTRKTQVGSYLDTLRHKTKHAEDEALIPNVLFHDNEQHVEILEDMARDLKLGCHLLLIGNQGVGKNKLTDRFLQLVNRPRQYMQLHRDTTVQTLTMQTVVENGIIRHEDSPLVKAARNGQILVIDEADKAPLHVVAILKNLLDSGNLVLGDGRTLLPAALLSPTQAADPKIVPIHKDFRIIMLANRPGFPFLGNNMFGVLGDLFAIHTIDHPDRASELEMLRKYGPNVPAKTLDTLLTIFHELREKTDAGLLQYPYSTRELVNIVRHCDRFPSDPLTEVARNVFDFDSFSEDAIATVEEVFRKHGVPLGTSRQGEKVMLARSFAMGGLQSFGNWALSAPKRDGFEYSMVEPAALTNLRPFDVTILQLDKQHSRNEIFSEQVCRWRLPMIDDSIVSDAVRIGDSLAVATVNPSRLYFVEDFKNASLTKEIDLVPWVQRGGRFKHQPKLTLANLGNSCLLVHEETGNVLICVDFLSQNAGIIQKGGIIGQHIGQMFSSQTSWRMAPSAGNTAVVYERNGTRLNTYFVCDGIVSCEELSVDFPIKRVVTVDENTWIITSTDARNHVLLRTNDGYFLRAVDSTTKIEPLGVARCSDEKEEKMLVADNRHYYLAGGDLLQQSSSEVVGRVRRKLDKIVDNRRPYYLADDVVDSKIDASREIVWMGKDVLARSQPKWNVPADALDKSVGISQIAGFLEVSDLKKASVAYVPVPVSMKQNYHGEWIGSISKPGFVVCKWNDEELLVVDTNGGIGSYELTESSLISSYFEWRKMTGSGEDEKMRMEFEREEDVFDMSKLDEPKLGKIDPNNAPHHGGNQWMGGTGGYNTAGLGGVGGPFRLDAGHDVHQMPEFAKEKVPEHIRKKAREIAKQEYAKKLKEINMSEHDGEAYAKLWKNIESHSRKLASVIDLLEAKRKEREWAKHQTSGDLDDGKLIEGVAGERNIYRRRLDKAPDPGAPQTKPKRLKLCFDVSGSMYRFNGYDKRLQNSLETALMCMASLDGKHDKIVYDLVGHSGESPKVEFVTTKATPKNDKERLDTMKKMLAHTQYCLSGDNTVESLQMATKELATTAEDFDESIVILVSDANLERYGIEPIELHRAMIKEATVNCFVIFIGSLGTQAERLLEELPSGKAFALKSTSDLPKLMETIFSSTIAQ